MLRQSLLQGSHRVLALNVGMLATGGRKCPKLAEDSAYPLASCAHVEVTWEGFEMLNVSIPRSFLGDNGSKDMFKCV